MTLNPSDRQYTKEHEWLKIQDAERNLAIVGITDYAQELINEDPYNEGWILQVILSDTGELSSLISADEYQSFTEQA